MKEIVEAAKKLDDTASPTVEQQRVFLDAVANAFRPGQATTQVIQEGVRDTSNQLQALSESTGINQAVGNIVGQTTNQIRSVQPVNPNTAVGSIDVTSPGTGAALGLNPTDQAIAARRKPQSPLSANMEQFGELFNR